MNRRERRRRARDPFELLKKIKVVSEVEAELADAVVCLPLPDPMYFPDNVTTTCARCGIGIFHRPHVPVLPPKICINCASAAVKEEKDKEEQAKAEGGQDGASASAE